ncbi:MAG: hypothetical protein QNJ01_15585 [Desulfobacterales bacterium]|nr:hypothetical protein [Desulfobacterales bacterium]
MVMPFRSEKTAGSWLDLVRKFHPTWMAADNKTSKIALGVIVCIQVDRIYYPLASFGCWLPRMVAALEAVSKPHLTPDNGVAVFFKMLTYHRICSAFSSDRALFSNAI